MSSEKVLPTAEGKPADGTEENPVEHPTGEAQAAENRATELMSTSNPYTGISDDALTALRQDALQRLVACRVQVHTYRGETSTDPFVSSLDTESAAYIALIDDERNAEASFGEIDDEVHRRSRRGAG